MELPRNCPRCQMGAMQEYGTLGLDNWLQPTDTDVRPPRPVTVRVTVCNECGYVEMYKAE